MELDTQKDFTAWLSCIVIETSERRTILHVDQHTRRIIGDVSDSKGFRSYLNRGDRVPNCPAYGPATKGRVYACLGKQRGFVPNRIRAVLRDG